MTQSHGASLVRPLPLNPDISLVNPDISLVNPDISPVNPDIPSAKLELTYPYLCGQGVAAEFDARVVVGLEDSVLLIGEIELFGFDANHQGAYEICVDPSLCNLIRRYIEESATERDRAYEALGQQKAASETRRLPLPHATNRESKIPEMGQNNVRKKMTSPTPSSDHGFASFVASYARSFTMPSNERS